MNKSNKLNKKYSSKSEYGFPPELLFIERFKYLAIHLKVKNDGMARSL